jgi:hypothetical protein
MLIENELHPLVTTNETALIFAIRYNVSSTTHFSRCIACLLCMIFYTRAAKDSGMDKLHISDHNTKTTGNNAEQNIHLSLCVLFVTHHNDWHMIIHRLLSYFVSSTEYCN